MLTYISSVSVSVCISLFNLCTYPTCRIYLNPVNINPDSRIISQCFWQTIRPHHLAAIPSRCPVASTRALVLAKPAKPAKHFAAARPRAAPDAPCLGGATMEQRPAMGPGDNRVGKMRTQISRIQSHTFGCAYVLQEYLCDSHDSCQHGMQDGTACIVSL